MRFSFVLILKSEPPASANLGRAPGAIFTDIDEPDLPQIYYFDRDTTR
jgi:hypothetical protein